ncbi:DUF1549 domain-containing protein [Singulisphaera acidiphila]|uniref:WD40 repeat-containing protein n=1 Tax=Singulisphaera acidiphila (strain ATCC BAA-1392 / DSM 18658 / VKM B-2454 / MOB10) TaxID=886293 RepID=L0DIZ4_SINAD|nr:DUF1549 domain-containing protein [Singulisphaera acidiphila]AGA28815.1 WD40 repeat-containing protein [Singulisphaera acidiphila DSM 18658]
MAMRPTWSLRVLALSTLFTLPIAGQAAGDPAKPAGSDETVSYYKQIRPIFQAQCQGCHQPAKAGGGYVMTAFDRLLAGGESKLAAIVPKKPEESHLLEQVTPEAGKAAMPKEKPPLSPAELDLIRRWVAQGASDDTPAAALVRYDKDHPPVYTRSPVVTALDYAPDGQTLAVGGFHEVLLWKADGSELVGRLIGLSERIESVRYSPDGKRLVVTGGRPGRMGEVQVWNVATQKLAMSVPVTFDTVYGASWSPDGSKIAFGCSDNTVRAIDSQTGQQVVYMGSHNDWVLNTAFSIDGSHLMSVGRDMTAKLTEVATQRFVDNITSITPGALKGGLASVTRHPHRDEILMGGSDGSPKIYRIHRETARKIGDDDNHVASFEAMPGRIFSVSTSADGKRFAAGSSLDGRGQVDIYAYEFDPANVSEPIKKILAKEGKDRSAEERAELNKAQKDSAKRLVSLPLPQTAIYAVAVRPDGKAVAAAGSDGLVRLIETEGGKLDKEFPPVPLGGTPPERTATVASAVSQPQGTSESEALPKGVTIAELTVQPPAVEFKNRFDYVQLVVTAKTETGDLIDVTRLVTPNFSSPVATTTPGGLVRPTSDGKATLSLTIGGKTAEVPVTVIGANTAIRVDYIHDVNPVLSRLGCNAGTCHGSAQGKNGFKLSLRGYDPLFDVRALTDDHGARRVNLASPDDSLMLLKATGSVPHVGGQLIQPGEPYYETLRNWITDGAKLEASTPKVQKIEVFPADPVVQQIGARQQLRVLATYASGEIRDVTREAFLESGNNEVAIADRGGLMTALRRGEAPILVRYEGAYAASTLTVMGDRTGFVWVQPPTYNKIDELTAAKWERMKILPSDLCSDAEFLRRVYLDLTGLPPSADDVRHFLDDPKESRVKRDELVDRLIGSPDFVDYWTNKWADLLQVNRKFLDVAGASAFRQWIRQQVEKNLPYDQLVRTILTSSGSNRVNPAAAYYKILREPTAIMENTTQLFLGVRFNCNKCHDHPFERWTQDQYYETSAYFAQVGLKDDPESKGRNIGGTAVEGAKALYEEVFDKKTGEVEHDRTKQVTPPKFPFPASHKVVETASRRENLADWITAKDNPYFAKSYVNRLWGYLFGVGVIEPIDDIRAGNPATNPELLNYLTSEFVDSNFDARHILRLICKSRTYQLSVATNKWNEDDKINGSHAAARRLPAEVLLDAVYRVTGSQSKFPGVPAGIRAAALPDSGVELPSGFLSTFGRPVRESACECERSSGLQLGPIMALVSGPTLADAIADPGNEISKLVGRETDDAKLVNELFMRVLNRSATKAEIEACLKDLQAIDEDHRTMATELGKRETAFALQRPQLEREREAAVATAQATLTAYEAELAPKLAELEKQKAEQTAKLEADANAYETGLPAKVAAWEKGQSPIAQWQPLTPTSVSDRNGASFQTLPDAAVLVSGKDEQGLVQFVAATDLTGITGVRLELLPDDSLPNKGPGRAPDGNFVINEIKVTAAPKADPKQAKPIMLTAPLADFSQGGFEIKHTVDGSPNGGKGWAIAPAYGVNHWATFETGEPVGFEGGTVLTVSMSHLYNGKQFMPGKFRISVTRLAKPIGLGLPEDLRAIVATAPEVRTKAQQETLLAYHRAVDPEFSKKRNAVNASKAPLPVDPKLQDLRNQLEFARKPVPVDPTLAQLRKDVEMSIQQAATRRLTTAQDVAWALINSPAFLFNH